MDKVVISIPQFNKTIESDPGAMVMDTLNSEGLIMYAPCGGKGTCGKCKVQIKGKANDLTEDEKRILTDEEIDKGIRLACRTSVLGDVEVYLLEGYSIDESKKNLERVKAYSHNSSIIKKSIQLDIPNLKNNYSTADLIRRKLLADEIDLNIMREISHYIDCTKEVTATLYNNEIIDIENGNSKDKIYGLAVDIGTTTVVCYLMDLNRYVQLAVSSMQNPQVGYGSDVISRIDFTIENEDGLDILREKIISGIDRLIDEVTIKADIDKKFIYECVIAGNTAMTHIFLGLNPKSLSSIPFNSVTKETVIVDSSTIGIKNMNKRGKVVVLPGVGGFVGADTISAMIAADLINAMDNRLLVDLGTNGEIVLSTPKGRYACSTAAGPAFEGARIKYGMQAFSGAINAFNITDDFNYTTIDNCEPKGICGSGLIDIVSEFLRVGIVKENGRIAEPEEIGNEKLSRRIIRNGKSKEVRITDDDNSEVYITQRDIRELQLAKGAIRAGINILLKVAGLKIEEIDAILLAGAFGNFIDKKSALNIGLFPQIDIEKVIPLGNAAGDGARIVLCDSDMLDIAKKYSDTTKHIELTLHPDFQEEFMESMYLR